MSGDAPELLPCELAELSSTPPLEVDDEVDNDAPPPELVELVATGSVKNPVVWGNEVGF